MAGSRLLTSLEVEAYGTADRRMQTRVGNFRQKNYSAEDGIGGKIGLFQRNSDCSADLGIPFRTHSAEEKNARNSLSWNKIEAKLSEYRSEPFRGRENNWEFRSVEHG